MVYELGAFAAVISRRLAWCLSVCVLVIAWILGAHFHMTIGNWMRWKVRLFSFASRVCCH